MEAGHHFKRSALITPVMTMLHYIQQMTASEELKRNVGMLVTKKKYAYQFSSNRLGISAKSPSRRRPENLEKVALFDI
jgi:hypothetical protein